MSRPAPAPAMGLGAVVELLLAAHRAGVEHGVALTVADVEAAPAVEVEPFAGIPHGVVEAVEAAASEPPVAEVVGWLYWGAGGPYFTDSADAPGVADGFVLLAQIHRLHDGAGVEHLVAGWTVEAGDLDYRSPVGAP